MNKTEASQSKAVDSRAGYTETTTHCKIPPQQQALQIKFFKKKKKKINQGLHKCRQTAVYQEQPECHTLRVAWCSWMPQVVYAPPNI